jgi:DNA-binding CsgD family transcriptional regulator
MGPWNSTDAGQGAPLFARLSGRAAELDRIRQAVRATAAGRGGVVLIEGEPGSGKSLLLTEAVAGPTGCRVFAGSADEAGRELPLSALLDCFRGPEGSRLRTELTVLLEIPPAPRGGEPFAAALASVAAQRLTERLLDLADRAPVVLVLDDLQWADTASLLVWHRLSQTVPHHALLLLGARRPLPRRAEPYGPCPDSELIALDPLSDEQTLRLATALLGEPPSAALRERLALGGGNPWYIRQLALAEAAPGLPPALLRTVADRLLGFLAPDTVDTLRLAALLGDAFTASHLAELTGRTIAALLSPLEEALAAGVLTERGELLEFRQGIVRPALEAALPTPVHQALRPEAARIAAPGHEGGPRETAPLDLWDRGQYAEAEERAWAAIRASEPMGGDHWQDKTPVGGAASSTGVCEAAGPCPPAADPASARPKARPGAAAPGTGVEGEAARSSTAADGAGRLGESPGPDRWGYLPCPQGVGGGAAGRGPGDPVATAAARYVGHLALLRRHRAEEALEHLDTGLAGLPVLAGALARTGLRARMLTDRARLLGQLDRMSEAGQTLREARAEAEASGDARQRREVEVVGAELDFWVGEWDTALAEADDALAALILGHRDHQEQAWARLTALNDQAGSTYALLARALRAERQGHPATALAVLLPALEERRLHVLPEIVRLALLASDSHTARRAVEAAGGTPVARRCRGIFEQDPDALREALSPRHPAEDRPLVLGQTLEDLAVAEAWRGDLEAARHSLKRAVDVYLRLGADWDIARADARLRSLGVRRGRRAAGRRPTTGWEALTPTELKVAQLITEGRSNPQIAAALFLSPRTVQTHVSHILGKLGMRSRTEVAREAAHHLPYAEPRAGQGASAASVRP